MRRLQSGRQPPFRHRRESQGVKLLESVERKWTLYMKKNLSFYVFLLLAFSSGIYLVLLSGSRLDSGRDVGERRIELSTVSDPPVLQNSSEAAVSDIWRFLSDNLRAPLSILLLQIIVIVAATKLVGRLFIKIGQPAVVGEIVAGILLGPSLLGYVFPRGWSFLFPASSMEALKLLGQIGVILFMFLVGMELDTRQLRKKAHAAVIISHASIIIPFFLGVLLSLFIYRSFAPPSISFVSFALFMGVAMSITAFPVLARIIEERGMAMSVLGSTSIACAAVDDVTAWCILALVVALVRADGIGASMTIFLAIAFILMMLYLVKPQLERVFGRVIEESGWEKGVAIGVLIFIFASACVTEVIGIHSLFGAFLAGVVMPMAATFRVALKRGLTSFGSAALLPLFFAFTGLRTQIGLLNDWHSWLVCLGVIAVAIIGKLGGSVVAARWTGMSWPDSFSLGALMNTRGLMELIVLNIGYDLGIIPQRIFAIMVLMAVTTTSMTGYLLSLGEFLKRKRSALTYHHEQLV
jgi:Kef-type K+ transport system membrane component KefB